MLYRFYVIVGTILSFFLRLFAPLARFAGSRFHYGLKQRFADYPLPKENSEEIVVWIHAASVGEIQAAVNLIEELTGQGAYRFFITVMTEQGHRVATRKLGSSATCLMAPLDAPFIVRRALEGIRPDLFVCVETELWPTLLTELRKAGIRMCMINGRLSSRSFGRYLKIQGVMQQLLSGFAAVSVIRAEDGRRFAALGVAASRICVTGNSKYACIPVDKEPLRHQCRERLGLAGTTVFICGSTRTGEEQLLLPVFEQLCRETTKRLIWIIAPRHLERIPALKTFLLKQHLDVELYSSCLNTQHAADVMLVDSMGELANLYAAGDFNFCGGSLVDKGGHNIMEVIRWGLPVYFGSSMDDFRDAVELVVPAGAGFQVSDAGELAGVLCQHMKNRDLYERACLASAGVSIRQGRALKVQSDMVRQLLEH